MLEGGTLAMRPEQLQVRGLIPTLSLLEHTRTLFQVQLEIQVMARQYQLLMLISCSWGGTE